MPFESWSLIVAIALLALVALAAWLVRRALAAARRAGRDEREPELSALVAERRGLGERLSEAQGRLAAMESAQREQQAALSQMAEQRAELRTRLEEMDRLAAALAESRSASDALARELALVRGQAIELGARLESSQAQAHERLALLDKVKGEMREAFQASASAILDEKSQRFSEHNATHLGQLLTPLREQLEGFRRIVAEVYEKEGRERTLLQKELESLRGLNLQIGSDALALTRALKGDSRIQGVWGEMVLERLLDASGLEKGREYETQLSFMVEDERPRPDVVVRLPEGRNLVIDAKVSLTAWERHCSAVDESERATQLREHVLSVRSQVDRLAAKPYADMPGLRTLDFVLMFVPVEAAFVAAARADENLQAYAFERGVIVVTASTLLATLRTVNSLWRFENRNRNVLKIADEAGKLHDRFAGLLDDLKAVEQSFQRSRAHLSKALDKVGGRGGLLRKVEVLRKLGANTKKALDGEALARLGDDDHDADLDSEGETTDGEAAGESAPATDPQAPEEPRT